MTRTTRRKRRHYTVNRPRADAERNAVDVPTWRRRRFWIPLVLLLLGVVWFAPEIVARTELRNRLIAWVQPELAGQIHVGAATAGWLTPLVAHDVTIRDLDGQPILAVAEMATQKSLLDLLSNWHDAGTIEMRQPQLDLVLRDNTSNLEELLAPLLVPSEESSEPIGLRGTIVDGQVRVLDETTGRRWSLDELQLTLNMPATATEPLTVELHSATNSAQSTGSLSANVSWQLATEPSLAQPGAGQLHVACEALDLSMLEPVVRRLGLPSQLAGAVDCQLDGTVDSAESGAGMQLSGQIEGRQLAIATPQLADGEQLRLSSLDATVDAQMTGDLITVRQLVCDSDLLRLRADGTLSLGELATRDLFTTLLAPESLQQYSISGTVDLARLTQMLPNTLHMREDTTVESGNVDVQLGSSTDGGVRQVAGKITTGDLAASRNGQTIQWARPIQVEFSAHSVADGFVIEQLLGESDFFEMTGRGDLNNGHLQAEVDLQQLATQLAQFLELGVNELRGQMTAKVEWGQEGDKFRTAHADVDVTDFLAALPSQTPWREEHLKIQFDGLGVFDGWKLLRADKARLQFNSGGDQLVANLAKPFEQLTWHALWPFDCSLQGEIDTWASRLRPWVEFDEVHLAGQIHATAKTRVSIEEVRVLESNIEAQELRIVGAGLNIHEPVTRVQARARYDMYDARLALPELTLASTSVSMRAEDVVAAPSENGYTLNGDMALRGDVARVANWFPTVVASDYRAAGQFTSQTHMETRGSVVAVSGKLDVQDLVCHARTQSSRNTLVTTVVAQPWKQVWSERNLQLVTTAWYDWASDHSQFQQLQIVSEAGRIAASGTVDQFQTVPIANLTGQIEYDLQLVSAKLNRFLGPSILLQGRQTQSFALRGPLTTSALQVGSIPGQAAGVPIVTAGPSDSQPLVSPDLTGEATFGWDAANIFGVALDRNQLTARLQNGTVSTNPLEMSISGGRVSLSPRLVLRGEPTLVMDSGRIAQNIAITPEMCQSWMKYVTPLLANAASAEGLFSVELDGARVPIGAPSTASLAGRLSIHRARIQPGPLTRQLVTLADQVSNLTGQGETKLEFLREGQSWLEIAEQNVDFQMSNGRVYHRNLQLNVGDAVIRSQGSVGLDQSLSLVADVPVLEKWIEDEPLLAGLRGQVVQIPIGGTFSQPQIDQQVIAQLTQQLIGGATRQYLQGELQKGLQKFLQRQ